MTLLAWILLAVAPQEAPLEDHPDVPRARVDEAIRKGIEHLRTAQTKIQKKGGADCDELVLLTFLHAGVPENDARLQELLQYVLEKPLEKTYQASLLAMCLEELDRVKYQPKIFHCAQFLVDNMRENGHFSYGEPTAFLTDIPSGTARKSVKSGTGKPQPPPDFTKRVKPPVKSFVPVRQMRKIEGYRGDNSNSQYAALGMRACHDAGIVFPREIIERARQWWIDCQHPADPNEKRNPSVATGPGASVSGIARGWCYTNGDPTCGHGGAAYASMTAGAVGAICIFDYMLKKDWKKDPAVADGLAWMDKNWSVTENLGPPETGTKTTKTWLTYYLYALERTGMLYNVRMIGNHDWYKEGALFLLDAQKSDGSWKESEELHATWETCYAILFLKRATRRLDVASGPGR